MSLSLAAPSSTGTMTRYALLRGRRRVSSFLFGWHFAANMQLT